MLLLVIPLSMCSKNIYSYFLVNSSVNIGFGKAVAGVVGGLNFCDIVLCRRCCGCTVLPVPIHYFFESVF